MSERPPAAPRPPDLSRRAFLGRAAGLCAAAAVFPDARALAAPADATPPDPWRMRLSTSSIHYKRLPLEAACERIAALGFEAIDIWSPHAGCPHLDEAVNRIGPEKLREILAARRLAVAAWSVYSGGFAKYAKFIGAMGGGVAIQGSAAAGPPAEMPARMKAFLESLKPLLELAREHQVMLAIENHSGQLLNSPDSLKAFMDLADDPHLGVALAPYHLQVIGASVEEAIARVAPRLAFFYAWQHQPGTQQLPGVGTTDFQPWLQALARVGYKRYVNPFMHGEPEPEVMTDALRTSRGYLLERAGRGASP